ncbi:TVP38/TMEM64 family protein [Metabacillus iocasae]|uniref:TVP38/TMEM64 family membrane protein n=1 Tax=Priestia iocasae TaxID=2291674 RepID=A0ABS2QV86_9BACI|nr:TVP38/TMEM64 family protein [Metabacillus iocasae]MBM7702646.1 putative membrane protein YdjX (TVP38/TMEM64 family) [Metabacillus iocasae]
MNFDTLQQYLTLEGILKLLEEYRSFGLITGLLLPMLEAFLPVLPLFAFVMANAAAFGLWLGFLISWIGTCAGSLAVFFLVRRFGRERFFSFLRKHKQIKKIMIWVERHGFGPLFLMLCFPFTPSAAINIVAGLSRVSVAQFTLAVLCGKMVMVFVMSFIGADFVSFFKEPIKTVIVAVIIFILWLVGKRIEAHLNVGMGQQKD